MNTDLEALRAFSARIGADPAVVQAAGGNTSVKVDDTLWVKASGLQLKDALAENVFVPLRLSGVRARIEAGEDEPAKPEVLEGTLRPSIETSLHALLPHKFVSHTHSVAGIAFAAAKDGEARIAARLDGLAWRWIPYVMPGVPLTRAVAAAMAERPADVLVLKNHGVVYGADSIEELEELHRELEARISLPVAASGTPDEVALQRILSASPGWRLPVHAKTHEVALDPRRMKLATGGVGWPDHAIFLADRIGAYPAGTTAIPADEPAKLVLVEKAGALVKADLGAAGDELALCLALVLERFPADAEMVYLPEAEVAALMGWEAEAYRQKLAKERTAGG
ncbi:class II aldolase/adducin family protein [Geminicoccus roseus]|uniref:class II aldolase/adducin family protein n=1 Tax=Geminicoccus roseus TaxID=404900 RepID=UPI0004030836|nr:class II aldolase/adducin family protein [Geminicoccus roseus]